MKKVYLIIIPLILLILISGYFIIFKKAKPIVIAPKEQAYVNQSLGEAEYSAKYFENWTIEEISTGNLGEAKDKVVFTADQNNQIVVSVLKGVAPEQVSDLYNLENRQQTEVSRLLADRFSGTLKSDSAKKEEVILIKNGDYLYQLTANSPGSAELTGFLIGFNIKNNLTVVEVPPEEDQRPIYKLYLGFNATRGQDCQAAYYREIYLPPQNEEIVFIPLIIKALLSPDQLKLDELKLFTAIPKNTRLLSFGYDNNRAIVNFSDDLYEAANICERQLRKSQIEKTLQSLSEVTNLQIKEVEIQVKGKPYIL